MNSKFTMPHGGNAGQSMVCSSCRTPCVLKANQRSNEWHVHPSRCGVGLQLRTVRTRTHKCTFELDSGAGELYDLVHDPEEMVNRFNDLGYRKIRKELEDMMRARPGTILARLPKPIGMA